MSDERKQVLAALGARLELTPAHLHTRGAKARVLELLAELPPTHPFRAARCTARSVGTAITVSPSQVGNRTTQRPLTAFPRRRGRPRRAPVVPASDRASGGTLRASGARAARARR